MTHSNDGFPACLQGAAFLRFRNLVISQHTPDTENYRR